MSFDLAEVLKGVSNPDTGREQIEYIPLNLIDKDPNNFYRLSDVGQLADNIATCGLQQPIRVRRHTGEESQGRYIIVSGHRRWEALTLLVKDDPERWNEVPCIVEHDDVSPALQQLRLIYANANTRTMSAAEISEQAVQVERLLYELKSEGYDFPGRMRDHVAEAVGASKTKLARLKVIRENLSSSWPSRWEKGELAESTAYAIAQLPETWQATIYGKWGLSSYLTERDVKKFADRLARIEKLECALCADKQCQNRSSMMVLSCDETWADPCLSGCCLKCESLRTCGKSCKLAADSKALQRAAHKDMKRVEKEQEAVRDKPYLDIIQTVYSRLGIARDLAGVSVEQLYEAQGRFYCASVDDPKQENLETGRAKITTSTPLPFGNTFYAANALGICAVADLLGCSTDYLLGRTDNPCFEKNAEVSESDTWQTGDPCNIGSYAVMARYCKGGRACLTEMTWDGDNWIDPDMEIGGLGIEILRWIELPEDCG